MSPRRLRLGAIAVGAIIALAALAITTRRFYPFVCDDAFISLRYSERLIHGQGLTWTDGERVEGYSNLLWVLLCALLGALGVDLLTAARVLGVLGMAAAIGALFWAARARLLDVVAATIAAVAFATAGPVGVWAIGGLEQPLCAALLAWGLVLAIEGRLRVAGVLFGLLAIARPDGALFGGLAAICVVLRGGWRGLRSRDGWVSALTLAAPTIALVALQLAFRRVYYDDWVPNTAHVKLGSSARRLAEGMTYLKEGLWPERWLIGGALVAIGVAARAKARRFDVILVVVPLVAWCVYVRSIGGDIFPGHRHLVVAILLLAILAFEALRRGIAFVAARGARVGTVAIVLGGAALAMHVRAQRGVDEDQRAIVERWELDYEPIGALLRAGFGSTHALVAVEPAGALPFYAGLPAIDMLGLNDRFIATHPPADFGTGTLAHELGDGAYVLSRAPDLVVFCGADPCFRSGREMVETEAFKKSYVLADFAAPGGGAAGAPPIESKIWVRRDSTRVGVHLDEQGRLHVPGYLFSNGTTVTLDASGRLALEAFSGAPASAAEVRGVTVPQGDWHYEVDASGPVAWTRITHASNEPARGTDTGARGGSGRLDFRSGPVAIDVAVMPMPPGAKLREIVFTPSR